MVIQVGEKWCKATTTWKFWWNFLAKSLIFSRYPSFSPFERPDAYKCYTFSESYGSRETRGIKSSTSKFDIEAGGILSSLWTQTGPWSDTASYIVSAELTFENSHHIFSLYLIRNGLWFDWLSVNDHPMPQSNKESRYGCGHYFRRLSDSLRGNQ